MLLEKVSKPKARKEYTCCKCGCLIRKGQEYSRVFKIYSDSRVTSTACTNCR